MKFWLILAYSSGLMLVITIIGSIIFIYAEPTQSDAAMAKDKEWTMTKNFRGTTYATEEAGIPKIPNHHDLAYIKDLEEKDGTIWITIDPVHYKNGKIFNEDEATITLKIAPLAGPYFLNAFNDKNVEVPWRTMEVSAIKDLLIGKKLEQNLLSDYYDPILKTNPIMNNEASLFFVQRKDNLAIKVYQKYRE